MPSVHGQARPCSRGRAGHPRRGALYARTDRMAPSLPAGTAPTLCPAWREVPRRAWSTGRIWPPSQTATCPGARTCAWPCRPCTAQRRSPTRRALAAQGGAPGTFVGSFQKPRKAMHSRQSMSPSPCSPNSPQRWHISCLAGGLSLDTRIISAHVSSSVIWPRAPLCQSARTSTGGTPPSRRPSGNSLNGRTCIEHGRLPAAAPIFRHCCCGRAPCPAMPVRYKRHSFCRLLRARPAVQTRRLPRRSPAEAVPAGAAKGRRPVAFPQVYGTPAGAGRAHVQLSIAALDGSNAHDPVAKFTASLGGAIPAGWPTRCHASRPRSPDGSGHGPSARSLRRRNRRAPVWTAGTAPPQRRRQV